MSAAGLARQERSTPDLSATAWVVTVREGLVIEVIEVMVVRGRAETGRGHARAGIGGGGTGGRIAGEAGGGERGREGLWSGVYRISNEA